MKARLLDNRWTVEISDFDITTASNKEVELIGKYLLTNLVVVIKDQHGLLPEEEIEFCERIGVVQRFPVEEKDRYGGMRRLDSNLSSGSQGDGIFRVTGKKNEHGEIGLFGHKETLGWHTNQPSNVNKFPFVWLYGVEYTKGSRTSWLNNKLSYDDLSRDTQDRLKKIKVYCGYKHGQYSTSAFFHDHVNKDHPVPLVYTNAGEITGLFFPFLQIFEFENDKEPYEDTMEGLKRHVLQEKYQYHHDWNDGDVVIAEQWLTVHKRWQFEDMDKRLLHRIAFGYENLKVKVREHDIQKSGPRLT